MKKTSSWLWGCVLIALGIILGINALGIAHINIFFPGWWTLFIIVPCAIGLFTDKRKSGPIFGLVLGICLLLSCLGVLPFGMFWSLLIPMILVLIGVTMLVRSTSDGEVADRIREARAEQRAERRNGHKVKEAEIVETDDKGDEDEDDDDDDEDDGKDFEEYWSTFGDQDINYNGKTFSGCRVDAVFGGADVDLRKAKITDKAILRTSSVFGGIIVYVPDDVKVEVASTAIFGGVSDKRKNIDKEKLKKTLFIDANCVFGSVEIR